VCARDAQGVRTLLMIHAARALLLADRTVEDIRAVGTSDLDEGSRSAPRRTASDSSEAARALLSFSKLRSTRHPLADRFGGRWKWVKKRRRIDGGRRKMQMTRGGARIFHCGISFSREGRSECAIFRILEGRECYTLLARLGGLRRLGRL